MRRKFLLKVMILSLLFVAMGGGDLFAQSVTTVTSETELASALAAGGNVALGASFKVDNTIEIKFGKTVTLDLNGYEISTEKEIYLIDNNGDLTIKDGSENKSGGLVVGLGIRNGYEKPARSIAAELTIYGGTFKNIYPDNGAAVYNQGQLFIYGGNFYGQNVAISNDNAIARIYGGYIDGYKYAITNTLLLEITDAQISGVIKTTGSNASTAISDAVTFYEARIGEPANYTSYKTFAEALTAAGNMTGDVTVDILEKVTMKNNLSGNYSSIEFVGKDTDAEIYLDVQGYITATGKKVAFEDLTLSKSAGVFITNAGFMNVAFGVYDVTEVTYTGCNFANGAYASSGKVTYNDCTFKRSHDKYGLWAYGNVDVTVNGGKFDDDRGIKMYAEGAAKTVDLTVKNVDFSAVTDKPAIVLTYGKSVNLENNTYSSTGVFELDKDGAPNGTEVTADIADLSCMNDIYSDCGVLVDGKIYTTIDDAKGVAKEGSVVTLFYEPETQVELPYGVELNTNNYGNVVVRDYYTYAEFNEYVRNGNCANLENKKVVLKDTERSYQNNQTAQFFVGATNINITDPVETVTLNKVTFEFLDDDNTNTYTSGELQVFAKNISFTECTFIGTAVSPWGVSNNENAETAAFIDCEWKNLRGRYGVHQNRASNLTVTECTFTDCERGIHTNSSTPLNIIITGNTFTGIGDAYGVLCIAENGNVGNATLNITGNIATGQTFLRQLNENATYEQISAILNTDNNTYGTAYVVGSKVPVAKIGDKTYYKFEEAISSVGADDVVIELLSDATLNYPARKEYGTNETTSLTINGNGNILTLHQTDTDWSSLGLVNEDAKFVFNNMTINKTKAGGNGAWNNHAIIFSSNVEMTDVTVNNSMAVQDGATLNNVTINEANGYYGLWINGNGQSVTMNGGSINATNGGRGIKIADEYVDDIKQVTLNVTGTTFNTAEKAAVLVSSTAGAKVTAEGCDITNVAADNTNFVWVDEDWAAYYNNVKVYDEATKTQENEESFPIKVYKTDINGTVRAYFKNLDELFAAKSTQIPLSDNYIELRGDVVANSKVNVSYSNNYYYNFGTSVENGVTMTFNYADNWNMLPHFGLGENITMNVPYLQVIGGDISIAGTLNTGYLYLYGTGEGVVIEETGVVNANVSNDKTVQVKGGTVLTVKGELNTTTLNVWTGDANNSELIVSGDNAEVNAATIHAWNGKDGVSSQKITVEDGAKLTATSLQADRGSVINLNNATIVAPITLGYGDNVGTLVETGNSTVEGNININSTTSTVTSDGGLENSVSTNKEGYMVVLEDGVYRIAQIVAKIGTTDYASLQDAINAAKSGDVIELCTIASMNENVTAQIPAGVTIKSNGFSIDGSIRMLGDLTLDGPLTITGGLWVGKTEGTLAATLAGDKLTANYFMFQRGSYNINADIDAVYGYLSYEATFEINSTITTTNTNGEPLWINGNVNLNNEANLTAKNIWLSNENTVLNVKEGASVIVSEKVNVANSGAELYSTGNISGLIDNSLNGTIVISGGVYTYPIQQDWCADGFIPKDNGDGTYGVVEGLAGDGTAIEPYIINSLIDLKYFRDAVNAGDTYAGKTVVLAADIDLAEGQTRGAEESNWTPIGNSTNKFQGTFDGQNHTISNLKIYDVELEYAGFFGYTTNATIKNVKVHNVDINAYSHVGAIAGIVYTGNVDNCHVSGTINLVSQYAYAAGITGYGYVTVKNSSVIAEGTGIIKVVEKTGAGGITGWRGEGNTGIYNCTVKNLNITAWSNVGGITGFLHYENTIDNCVVDNVNLYKTREDGQASIGLAAGGWAAKANNVYTITVKNTNFSNMSINGTAINSFKQNGERLIGSNYSYYINIPAEKLVVEENVFGENITDNLSIVVKSEAHLGYALASDEGEVINIGNDIVLEEVDEYGVLVGLKIEGNRIIDLNGFTISGTDNATGSFGLINIQPNAELTINDSSEPSTGKITLRATNNREWNAYSSVISNQRGKLTVNGGTIEHLGGTDMAYAIDNLTNGTGTYAETVINGGTIKSTYRAIRQFLNGTEAQNILTVNGGIIEGANKSIWMQDPSKNANTGTLTVGENAQLKGDVYLYVTEGSTSWPVEVSIAVAALAEGSEVISANVPAGYEVKEMNDVYGVYHGVAKINNVLYESLAEAATAAQNGETIKLLWQEGQAPIAMNASLYGKNVIITGNATVDWNKGFLFVGRGGAGDATLTFDGANLTSASNSSSYGIHVSGREKDTDNKYDGTLVIKNSTIELDYLIDRGTITLDEGAKLTVKNGFGIAGRPASETEIGENATATISLVNGAELIVKNHNGMGVGQAANVLEGYGIMHIDATSTFETTQNFNISANGTMNNAGTVNIAGALTNNGTINFTDDAATLATTTGGLTINYDLNPDKKVVYVDGVYKVVEKVYVAQIGENKYETLIEAVDAVADGGTITLIANETFTETNRTENNGWYEGVYYFGDKSFTIDLGGFTIGQDGSVNDYLLLFKNDGDNDNTITLKNGTIDAGTDAYCAICTSTTSTQKITINTENIEFIGNNSDGAVLKIRGGAELNVKAGTVITGEDSYLGIESSASTVNIYEGAEIYMNGTTSYNGCLVGVGGNGTINVYGGKGTGKSGGFIAMTSGGTINVYDGEWIANTDGTDANSNKSVLVAQNDKQAYPGAGNSIVNVTGGIFRGGYNCYGIAEGDVAQINISGGNFNANPENYVIEGFAVETLSNGTYNVIPTSGTQTRELEAEWYWFSTYVDLNANGQNSLDIFKSAFVGEDNEVKVRQIKNQNGYVSYNSAYDIWVSDGGLLSITNTGMYMINMKESHTLELTGDFAERDLEITLNTGWNWIGYPVNEEINLTDALSELEPSTGDMIKSQTKSAYWTGLKWKVESGFDRMIPGEGYKYFRKSGATKFSYSTDVKPTSKSDDRSEEYHWIANANQYPGNMTVIAMLSIDNEIVNDNYEIAAFANGECRGSAHPIYDEDLNAYILILTIQGEEVEELTFKYYDVNYGTEYELGNRINYSDDAIVGSFEEPYMFNLGILNIDESSVENISIYPNPTTTGKEINLQAVCDKVEVFNALGVKVAEYTNVDSIDAIETAGIYVIRVTIDGNARNCRLIVK